MFEFDIKSLMADLSHRRKVFFSEADFQHELAHTIRQRYSDVKVYLEVSRRLEETENNKSIDIICKLNKEEIPIELKYRTKKFEHVDNVIDEKFSLKTQSAFDHSRYDFFKDVWRIHQLKKQPQSILKGYAIFLTNEDKYWSKSKKEANTYKDGKFHIHEGRTIEKSDQLKWNQSSKGNTKGRTQSFNFGKDITINWFKFSESKKENIINTFKYTFIEV